LLTTGTKERIDAELLGEELSKGFTREDIEGGWVRRRRGRQVGSEEQSDLGIAGVSVKAIITDALKAFREDMLEHPADKA